MAQQKKKTSKSINKLGKYSNTGAFLISILAIICFTAIIIVGYVFINVIAVTNGEPVINLETAKNNQNQTSFLYAENSDGKQIEYLRLHGTENRIWVDKEKIPKQMRDCFIAIEDKRFEKHHGVDWIRTVGVMIKPSAQGQGGSTITQQLVKNITGNNEVTFVRKYNEIVTALNLEHHYSKEQILEAYMNTVYLGQGCYGVETAAETYFGKDVSELNYAECAIIAGITKAPYTLDPIYYPDANRSRQEDVLYALLDQGKITKAQYDEALSYDFILTTDDDYVPSEAELKRQKEKEEAQGDSKFNSFYVDFVIEQVIDDLQKEMGCSYREATSMIYGGGLKIYTAVDLDVQKKLEEVYVNKTNWLDRSAQSAMTIMDYNGRVVAICGQAGEKEGNRVLNRACDSPRSPGSTIKPLSAYAPAIESGDITWGTYIMDYAIRYQGTLRPKNYSGSYGSGSNVSVQVALAESLNTVPARIIYNMLGIDNSYDWVKNKFHISTLIDGKDNNLSPLSVGSMTYGITSLELTAAYASFGNGGYYYEPYSYYYIENSQGKVILDNRNPKGEQVMSTDTADVMRHLLETVTTSTYGTGYNYKTRGFDNYAKTGTTDDNYDKWMVGGTPYYVGAVWYGYDTPKTIYTSGNPAGTIYKTVMDKVHEDLADKEFEDTGNAVRRYYCTYTGKLASSSCGSTALGWFTEDNLPSYCGGHYYAKDDDDDKKDSKSDDKAVTTAVAENDSGNDDSSGGEE